LTLPVLPPAPPRPPETVHPTAGPNPLRRL